MIYVSKWAPWSPANFNFKTPKSESFIDKYDELSSKKIPLYKRILDTIEFKIKASNDSKTKQSKTEDEIVITVCGGDLVEEGEGIALVGVVKIG